jgi:hypothetical protein
MSNFMAIGEDLKLVSPYMRMHLFPGMVPSSPAGDRDAEGRAMRPFVTPRHLLKGSVASDAKVHKSNRWVSR